MEVFCAFEVVDRETKEIRCKPVRDEARWKLSIVTVREKETAELLGTRPLPETLLKHFRDHCQLDT